MQTGRCGRGSLKGLLHSRQPSTSMADDPGCREFDLQDRLSVPARRRQRGLEVHGTAKRASQIQDCLGSPPPSAPDSQAPLKFLEHRVSRDESISVAAFQS